MADQRRPPRRRTSPKAEQLAVWRTFIETFEQMRTAIESRLHEESGLSSGDYRVLLALSEAPGRRLRPSVLAAEVAWERSRLSHHLSRMEKRGLIGREECATDSRGAEVVLTEEGATIFRRASAPHLRAVNEIFIEALTPAQLDALGEATLALRAHLKVA